MTNGQAAELRSLRQDGADRPVLETVSRAAGALLDLGGFDLRGSGPWVGACLPMAKAPGAVFYQLGLSRAQMQAALAKSCSEDVKKLCPTAQPGRETRLCLIQNRDTLSDGCSKVLSKMRQGGAGRRGGGGGGGQ